MREKRAALQGCREENTSSTSVVSLAWKYPWITERHRTFGDPLRVRHFSIDESWLPLPLPATELKRHIELPRRLEAQEKNMIEEALKASRGRVFGPTGAAAKLGIPRSTLESKIKSLKIDKNRFRTHPETWGL
jgi:DNA-binding NtrC family response regulator